jgi:hypothetical protein
MIANLPTLRGFAPRRYDSTSWSPHVPFGYDLVAELRPRLIVELGTHRGESYFTFCQSACENETGTLCYAVDTWKGDQHAGRYDESVYKEVEAYNREFYRDFSYLLRMTFDEARSQFSKESIGLLHIDGCHTYEDVRQDYETWLPLVRPDGIILLHDVAVRRPSYGVWRLWEEIARPGASFAFDQGWGLGVLKKAPDHTFASGFLNRLFAADERDRRLIRNYYSMVSDSLRLQRILSRKSRRRRWRVSIGRTIGSPLRSIAQVLGRDAKGDS